jgi:hypothetical protein
VLVDPASGREAVTGLQSVADLASRAVLLKSSAGTASRQQWRDPIMQRLRPVRWGLGHRLDRDQRDGAGDAVAPDARLQHGWSSSRSVLACPEPLDCCPFRRCHGRRSRLIPPRATELGGKSGRNAWRLRLAVGEARGHFTSAANGALLRVLSCYRDTGMRETARASDRLLCRADGLGRGVLASVEHHLRPYRDWPGDRNGAGVRGLVAHRQRPGRARLSRRRRWRRAGGSLAVAGPAGLLVAIVAGLVGAAIGYIGPRSR